MRPLRFESTAMPLHKFSAGQNNHREVAIMKILIRFYLDPVASTVLLYFCYDSCRFGQNFESQQNRRPVEWGFNNVVGRLRSSSRHHREHCCTMAI